MGRNPLGLYSNSSPQTYVGWSDINLSLEVKTWKHPSEGGLVKTSTSWLTTIVEHSKVDNDK